MYDLIVVGGGLTGVGAAVAASRNGMKVLLLEKNGYLSGAACNNFVTPFMPYHVRINGEKKMIAAGFFAEIIEELKKMDGYCEYISCFNEEYLKLVLDRFVKKENMDALFHALVSNVEVNDGKITGVKTQFKGQEHTFNAKYFIDCTGDANIAAMANCPFRLGREEDSLCQPMTLCFRMSNIDKALYKAEKNDMNNLFVQYQQEGKISIPREKILNFDHSAPGVIHFNTTRIIKKNPTDIYDISKAEMEAREQMYELFMFLKDNFQSCKNATLLSSAPEIGVRESRRICGEYTITVDDLKAFTKFEDGIAACNYDIDIHNPSGTGTSHFYFKDGEYYTIPYRCLLPKGIKNLLVAGRCVSATHEAQASLRTMPTCTIMGQAAGTAAFIAKADNVELVRDIDTYKLKETLKANGAFI